MAEDNNKNSGGRRDAVAHITGVAAFAFAGEATLTAALASVGVDTTDMLKAMHKCPDPVLKALHERTLSPQEVNLPLPKGLAPEKHADLTVVFASAILDGRAPARDRRVKVAVAIIAGVAVIGAAFVTGWFTAPNASCENAEREPVGGSLDSTRAGLAAK